MRSWPDTRLGVAHAGGPEKTPCPSDQPLERPRRPHRLPKFRCKPDITGWHLSLSFLGVSAKRRIFNLDCEVDSVYASYPRREVYETVQRVAELPVCNERFGKPLVPYFLPVIVADKSVQALVHDAHWYLPEDFSFSERARRAGCKIMADSAIRLGHIENYEYGWEDVGGVTQRARGGTFRITTDADDSVVAPAAHQDADKD